MRAEGKGQRQTYISKNVRDVGKGEGECRGARQGRGPQGTHRKTREEPGAVGSNSELGHLTEWMVGRRQLSVGEELDEEPAPRFSFWRHFPDLHQLITCSSKFCCISRTFKVQLCFVLLFGGFFSVI